MKAPSRAYEIPRDWTFLHVSAIVHDLSESEAICSSKGTFCLLLSILTPMERRLEHQQLQTMIDMTFRKGGNKQRDSQIFSTVMDTRSAPMVTGRTPSPTPHMVINRHKPIRSSHTTISTHQTWIGVLTAANN